MSSFRITAKMADAWVAYETAEHIPLEWNYVVALRMLRHAFLSGYSAASGIAARSAKTVKQGSTEGKSPAPEGDAQTQSGPSQ